MVQKSMFLTQQVKKKCSGTGSQNIFFFFQNGEFKKANDFFCILSIQDDRPGCHKQ